MNGASHSYVCDSYDIYHMNGASHTYECAMCHAAGALRDQ